MNMKTIVQPTDTFDKNGKHGKGKTVATPPRKQLTVKTDSYKLSTRYVTVSVGHGDF